MDEDETPAPGYERPMPEMGEPDLPTPGAPGTGGE